MLRAAPLLSLALLIGGTACDDDNRAACESYVEAFTALPCAVGQDPGVDCNAAADYPCPIRRHFECLEQGFSCDGEELVGDVAACAELLECEG